MTKPTLVVLAAGMGSRYGGLKQMDAFGPSGETIIDYSIYDAIQAGFGKVVFIIRESFKSDFEAFFSNKFEGKIEVSYVCQELDRIPKGKEIHPERQKPWGTAHAVAVAQEVVDGPFAVINADDYYGKEAFATLAKFFDEGDHNDFCLVAYYLANTLSDHGTVNRGICAMDKQNYLVDIQECLKIKRNAEGQIFSQEYPERPLELEENTLVSMNMFGFFPSYFTFFDSLFSSFLDENGMLLRSEFYIPTFLDNLIKTDQLKVKVLASNSEWFGVTYKDDKPIVKKKLLSLIEKGMYPKNLWASI